MNANTENSSTTFYFGLSVEVVHRMKTCSLVRFSGRDSIVDTDDLAIVQRIQPGLTRTLSPQQSCAEPAHFLYASRRDDAVTSGFESTAWHGYPHQEHPTQPVHYLDRHANRLRNRPG